MSVNPTNYISTSDLANFLGISTVAVFKRIIKGRIKATKIGRSYAIPRSYVQEHFPGFAIKPAEVGEYFSVMEAAKVLGISRVAVFKKIKNGIIKAKRVGRHYVIAKNEIVVDKRKSLSTDVILTKDYYSVIELADLLGVSRFTIFNQIKKGLIKAEKIGRHYCIAKDDLPFEGKTVSKTSSGSDTYHSVLDVAKQLGLSRVAVFKKIKDGQIKAIKVGRSYAITESEFNKALLKKTKKRKNN